MREVVHGSDVISDMNTAENSMETAVDFKVKKKVSFSFGINNSRKV